MRRAVTLVVRRSLAVADPQRRSDMVDAFQRAGCAVEKAGDDDVVLDPRHILIVLGNINFFPKLRRKLRQAPWATRPFTVIWHSEPLPPPRTACLPAPKRSLREIAKVLLRDSRATDAQSNLSLLCELAAEGIPDLLLATSLGRWEVLGENGVAAECVPLGHHPLHGQDLGLPRDIDVLFLGDLRVGHHKRGLRYLRRRGVDVAAIGSWSDGRYWGARRTQILNRAKIFLNIQRNAGELSGFRFILGMANKALVISEPTYRPAPYLAGRHYVSATLEEMPDAIHHYLTRPEERQSIVDEAHRFITQEQTLAAAAEKIVGLIDQRIPRVQRVS